MNDVKKYNILKQYLNSKWVNIDDYLILTDRQAEKKCKEHILDSLWAFNTEFIADYIDFENKWEYNDFIKYFKNIQSEMCENANSIVKLLLGKNINKFIKDAIKIDGRGHFLSHYDGIENKYLIGNIRYYIYRIN